jgi:hypothetical protein
MNLLTAVRCAFSYVDVPDYFCVSDPAKYGRHLIEQSGAVLLGVEWFFEAPP